MLAWTRPGAGEILVVILVLLLLFGARRIPEIARAIGRSLNEFKKGVKEGDSGDKDEEPRPPGGKNGPQPGG
jgi:sec-independent protein translocase protein TatA